MAVVLWTANCLNQTRASTLLLAPCASHLTFAVWWTGFPDAHTTIDDMVAEGDQVAKRWTFRGTQTGEFQGIPPTGKAIVMTGITIYRFVGGKVAECWWNYDRLGAMQQIGVIPPME